ncbi:MAG: S9 family peptidase [Holophagales bacterium]|nr:S9 family peptidase [Holophagales bacterium]
MLKLSLLSIYLIAAGFAAAQAPVQTIGQTPVQGPKPFSIHDMLAMDRIQEFRVSPDGSTVVYTLSVTDLEANRRRSTLWLVGMDGKSRQLTPEDMSAYSPRWAKDGSVYFISSKSGSSQVWKINSRETHLLAQVTDLPLDVDNMEISPAGDFLILSMAVFPGSSPAETKRAHEAHAKRKSTGMVFDQLFVRHWDTWSDGTRNHIFHVDIKTGTARDLMLSLDGDAPTKPFGGSEEYAISPDGKTLIFTARMEGRQEAWSTNLDLWEVPIDGSKEPARITSNPATDTHPVFSPNGKSLAYAAMTKPVYEADRLDLIIRDMDTKRERRIVVRASADKFGDRSVGELVWSPDGKEVLCTSDHLGQKAIFAVDVAKGTTRIVYADGANTSPKFLADGRIVFGRDTLTSPLELFTIGTDGKGLKPLTRVNEAKMAAALVGTPEQFTFTGARNETVYGYVVKPINFDPSKKYPVAFLIHGGPQGSFGNHFHYRWNPQAYVGAGYAVVMIDFHGSTGYGQDFTDAINGDWGGAPFEDLMKGLDAAIKKYTFLDDKRIGALGASYGGYMINWIAGQAPDRFRALVCHDGNLDERMAYFDTEELWFPEWEHMGTPWDNPESYSKHNPIDHVSKWKTPMLVIHGGKDYRVVDTQGLSTFTALQRRGIPSRLIIFPDENHWILKPANSIQWHNAVIKWLDQWVKKD